MNFGKERAGISFLITIGVILKMVLTVAILYCTYYLVSHPGAIGAWVGTLIQSFNAAAK